MTTSILEKEILGYLNRLRATLTRYDRGVLVGFVFSLFPIFPLALIGLCIGFAHLLLYKVGRGDAFNYRLVKKGIALGLINSVACILIVVLVIQYTSTLTIDLAGLAKYLTDFLIKFVNALMLKTYQITSQGTAI